MLFVNLPDMNLLAHAYLSGNNNELLIGNLVADHVRKTDTDKLTEQMLIGVELHRKIDTFTDSHHMHIQSRKRLPENQKKYSGVIIDIFYDHFLGRKWNKYSDIPIKEFTRKVYWELVCNYTKLPSRTKYMLPFLIASNWMATYGEFEELQKRFDGMASYRASFASGMETAVSSLKNDYANFEKDFDSFFPELMEFAKQNIS